ncbi:hypothetical protein RclHR1_04120011 [Rhizophagus clarus]|uniref:BTB/POZ domain-containing protein n=1 Tax=Rhizophagus clarus TaxID=94130 RepID=A0A2Z6RH39_9GLOM|nr:hypothetical protein RclHR1_04120011 [Rhizophagus clarus]GES84997.1 BTB/POZ domain-containing protein [Rhizophagus clarus]
MSFKCWKEVIDDYEKLLENENGHDIIICAGGNEEIRAHSVVLSIRSQYFRTELSKVNVEKRNGKIIFKRPDIPSRLFKMILRFIYCGRINLNELEGTELLKLLMVVDDLNVRTLFLQLENYLIQNKSAFLHQNTVETLETIYQRESFINLRNFCLEKVYKEPKILFETDKFINLKAPLVELLFRPPLLELLLKRDDLILEEIIVWNSLLKWGLAQNSSISQDSTKWNEETIKIMERTLHRLIPLVRFYDMPSRDFLIRRTNIDIHPSRRPKFDSVIIQPKHLSILASWIDKKENFYYNVMSTPYKFNLLYRANRDGNTAAAFHSKCDNKGATILIVKIKDSEHIVGGYSSQYWESGNGFFKSANDSFIFSFIDRNDLQTAKVGCIKEDQYQNAIYCDRNWGPIFGNNDLIQYTSYNIDIWGVKNPCSYSKIDVPENYVLYKNFKCFIVEDYEVFQVVKK